MTNRSAMGRMAMVVCWMAAGVVAHDSADFATAGFRKNLPGRGPTSCLPSPMTGAGRTPGRTATRL